MEVGVGVDGHAGGEQDGVGAGRGTHGQPLPHAVAAGELGGQGVERRHHRAARQAGGRHRERDGHGLMRVHDVVPTGPDDADQPRDRAGVQQPADPRRPHGQARGPELLEHARGGDLHRGDAHQVHLDPGLPGGGGERDEQRLGAAQPEAVDQDENSQRASPSISCSRSYEICSSPS